MSAPSARPGDSAPEIVPFTGVRGAVARAMQAAWQAPRVAVGIDVTLDACLAHREELAAAGADPRPSPTHYVLRAAALALTRHPRLNGWVEEDHARLSRSVDIGIAVDAGEGIVVPVLRDVAELSVEAIADGARALTDKARRGQLKPSEQRGASFSVSTLGATGIGWFTPILNPPQIAILGVGAIDRRPIVRDEQVAPAHVATLTLVFDHRATDGRPASEALAEVRDLLEHPERL